MKLTEVCNKLRQARKEKNISLEQIYEKTRLHPSILRKIEDGESLEDIGKFYLKGFLKIYARFLGQDNLIQDIDQALIEEKPKKQMFKLKKEKPAVPKEMPGQAPKTEEKINAPALTVAGHIVAGLRRDRPGPGVEPLQGGRPAGSLDRRPGYLHPPAEKHLGRTKRPDEPFRG